MALRSESLSLLRETSDVKSRVAVKALCGTWQGKFFFYHGMAHGTGGGGVTMAQLHGMKGRGDFYLSTQ